MKIFFDIVKLKWIGLYLLLVMYNKSNSQSYYKVSCPNLNGDIGNEYAIDSINFFAYVSSQDASGWKVNKINLQNGTYTTLNILANNNIRTLYFKNDTLYIGGDFTTINNSSTYKYFVAYNTKYNSILPGLNPQLNGSVTDIIIHQNKLFIAGSFTQAFSSNHQKLISFNLNSGTLSAGSISNFSLPSDLSYYFTNRTGKIAKMKSHGSLLFFILDDLYLYNFAPYAPPFQLLTYQYSCEYGGGEEKLYDYDISDSKIYVSGNISYHSTDNDLLNLINGNPTYYDLPNHSYGKAGSFDLYDGSINDYATMAGYFQSSPSNSYGSQINYDIPFGITGIKHYNNKFFLIFNRSDYPSLNKNCFIESSLTFNSITNSYLIETANPGGNMAYTPYHSYHNAKAFSNILTVFDCHKDYHAGNYYNMAPDNDSIIILRMGNAKIQGFTQNPGSICKGDTVSLKLKTQGNFHNYQWIFLGGGMNIIHAYGTGDSVRIKFNYAAQNGNLKIVAYDNFNQLTDTFIYPITFKPVPDISAGPDKTITCKYPSVKLKGSTSLSHYNIDWLTPAGLDQNDSLTFVSNPGTYYARIKNLNNGCYGYDTISVIIDTLKPDFHFSSSNNYTLTCKKTITSIQANAVINTDSIKWYGLPAERSSSIFTTSSAGKYYVSCISSTNGCIKRDSIQIDQNIIAPTLSSNTNSGTLTCTSDSILISGSSTSNVILYWDTPSAGIDSLNNPLYAKLTGNYTLYGLDTTSGCSSQTQILIHDGRIPPFLNVSSHSSTLTCSQPTISLQAGSATPGATLFWVGPNSFSSGNPATVSVIGTYTITSTDPTNGCSKQDTVRVFQQNALGVDAGKDSSICYGNSIQLSATAIGGTPPFTYQWSNSQNTSNITVSPVNTSTYIVTVNDANNCTGKDTVIITVPTLLKDSVVSFQPCDPNNPNGQIQAFGSGGTPPYQYNINGGAFQNTGIFTNLNFGGYQIIIKDQLGCSSMTTAQINDQSLAPSSDFLVATNLFKTDTFVVIDISQPKPDSVQWSFPATFTVINTTDPFAPVVICTDTGFYQIKEIAYFGSCKTEYNKQVHIRYNDGSYATPYNNNGIQNITLYPNPNSGQFNLLVTFYKKQSFVILVTDAVGTILLKIPVSENDQYSGYITIPNVTNGTHVLKVISTYDNRHILFEVTQ